jgi:hypothetical protein
MNVVFDVRSNNGETRHVHVKTTREALCVAVAAIVVAVGIYYRCILGENIVSAFEKYEL